MSEPPVVPYPVRIPDGEYTALCTHVYHGHSKTYGERVYLDFQIYLGEHEGKTIQMFLRPNIYPTTLFYRAWSIAHGGPPRSKNTKMSPRIFTGKLFRILTATVTPRQRIGGHGKTHTGPFLPESFWYSKVACLLALEVTNEEIPPGEIAPPIYLTNFSPNPLLDHALIEGKAGSRKFVASKERKNDLAARDENLAARDENNQQNTTPPAGKGGDSLPASSLA